VIIFAYPDRPMKELISKIYFYFRLSFATGLLVMRTRELRRKLMFFVSLAAMLSVFFGGVVIIDALVQSPWLFIGYWFVSGTLVLGMVLLALYDILRLKGDQALTERDELIDLLKEVEKAAAEEAGEKDTNTKSE